MTTITSSTTLGITLTTPAYTIPVVVEPGVTIAYKGGGSAIEGSAASAFWTIQNSGTVSGYYGIFLNGGGAVTNTSGGLIKGYGHGVAMIDGFGAIINSGSVIGVGTLSDSYGVRLAAGGSVINTVSASIVGFFIGIHVSNALGTVVNDGNITGVAQNELSYGVRLSAGGSVTNGAGGLIRGRTDGIAISERYNGPDGNVDGSLAEGTVVNYGSIYTTGNNLGPDGPIGYGIIMYAGGVVTNAASALIAGGFGGVVLQSGAMISEVGTVINGGTIIARNYNVEYGVGVKLNSSGLVINEISAFIGGAMGLTIGGTSAEVANYGTIAGSFTYPPVSPAVWLLATSNTLISGGTIIGESGIAVQFAATGNNLLVLDPGAIFEGLVVGGSSAQNTIELASGTSTGTLTGLGTEFTNFGSIAFETGPGWFISGNTSGLAGVISGFSHGDTIEVTNITVTGSSYVGGILTLTESSGQVTLNLPGSFTTSDFVVANVADGADIEIAVPCFARGTSLATPNGQVPVEALREGDEVLAHFGDDRFAPQSIRWIGYRSIDCRRHPNAKLVWPVRISAGAFGPGKPNRDLLISPDHAVFVDNVLIPAKHLMFGRTIVQIPMSSVSYFHVELATHAIILAEGLEVESYLDVGDRGQFCNCCVTALHPAVASRVWEAQGCAPLVVTGEKLNALRRRMMKRANVVQKGMIGSSRLTAA